jgi:hypothetical protein
VHKNACLPLLLPVILLLTTAGCCGPPGRLPRHIQFVNKHPFPVQITVGYREGLREEFTITVPAHSVSGRPYNPEGRWDYIFQVREPDGMTTFIGDCTRESDDGACVIEVGPSRFLVSPKWSWQQISQILVVIGTIGWLIFLADTFRRTLRR